MFTILLILTTSFSLALILMTVAQLISKKTSLDREKISPFECGFDPSKSARLPFSLRFFLVAVIFLIFDVEITLLLPVPLILMSAPMKIIIPTAITFIIALLSGLYYEWYNGALEWAY